MVHIMSLWLPIVVSAVLVFFASFLIHMVLGYHRADYKKLADENGVMDALRKFNIAPGDYLTPCAGSAKEMKDPAFQEKWSKGPVFMMTIMKPGPPAMGGQLGQWFLYCLLVGVFSAYLAGRALPAGAPYLAAFRFAVDGRADGARQIAFRSGAERGDVLVRLNPVASHQRHV